MPSITSSDNGGTPLSKPFLAIPLFAMLILLAMFIPRLIQPSFPSSSRTLLYYPRATITSFCCNNTLVFNISSRQPIRVEQVVAGDKTFDLGITVNGTFVVKLSVNCSEIPRIALVRISYNGRMYNRYVYVAHRCYK